MNKTEMYSPPVSSETRLFNVPDSDIQDVIFTFNFDIKKIGTKDEISFTLDLNRALVQGSPPPEPETYVFDKNGKCLFNHQTDEGYYVKGKIDIISFKTPVGQFDNNYKNFLFDIEIGDNNALLHNIEGLFELIDPESQE